MMVTTYVYCVVDINNATLAHRVNKDYALRSLEHFRKSQPCALILETTYPDWRKEEIIVSFDQPVPQQED